MRVDEHELPFVNESAIYHRAMRKHEDREAGAPAVDARAHFSVLIHGANRIAYNLYALLLGSGFGSVRVITPSPSRSPRIERDDFNALTVTNEDMGREREHTLAQIALASSILTHELEIAPSQPDLILSTSRAEGDYRQRWLSESTPHLYLHNGRDGYVEIGPLVIPGKSPCLTCYELHQRDCRDSEGRRTNPRLSDFRGLINLGSAISVNSLESLESLETVRSVERDQEYERYELSVTSSALVASILAAEISSYAASGLSTLFGRIIPISLLAPVEQLQSSRSHLVRGDHSLPSRSPWQMREVIQFPRGPQSFDFHPECGCVDGPLSV